MACKRKCKTLSVEEKRRILQEVDKGDRKKVEIAKTFGIPPNTLSTILKNRTKYEGSDLANSSKRAKLAKFGTTEQCVLQWLKQCRDKNIPISGPILQLKATAFAKKLGHEKFRASNGWLQKFKKRNDIVFRKLCGESSSVDKNICTHWIEKLSKLTEDYTLENIYNADETALFFKCLPDKTMIFKGETCSGGKSSKERLTVLLCANATGSVKLKPLLIGKAKNPRCFKGVKSFPTDYTANTKAWMTSDIFGQWLKDLNNIMQKKKKKILLFIDNCSAHGTLPYLSHIKIEFLPANTTSKLQPLDQGIIQNMKCLYRKEVVHRFLHDIENDCPTKINVLDAMWMLTKAWNSVSANAISNCFKKAGFKVGEEGIEDNMNTDPASILEEPTGWTDLSRALNSNNLRFEEFVNVDSNVAVCGDLSDEDILSSVLSTDQVEEEDDGGGGDEPIQNPETAPTQKEARAALDLLRRYFVTQTVMSDKIRMSISNIDSGLD